MENIFPAEHGLPEIQRMEITCNPKFDRKGGVNWQKTKFTIPFADIEGVSNMISADAFLKILLDRGITPEQVTELFNSKGWAVDEVAVADYAELNGLIKHKASTEPGDTQNTSDAIDEPVLEVQEHVSIIMREYNAAFFDRAFQTAIVENRPAIQRVIAKLIQPKGRKSPTAG